MRATIIVCAALLSACSGGGGSGSKHKLNNVPGAGGSSIVVNQPSEVPAPPMRVSEPSSGMLFALGGALIFVLGWRRSK